jgi:2,4-dienoyl-CoA reductase-like NADH-dependent reductase (Old Yellow Enzyme family)
MTSSDPLLQPYQLKHLTLKNRVMSTSHEPAFSEDGMPKERYRLYHAEKAKGGMALTMTAGSAIVSRDSPAAFGKFMTTASCRGSLNSPMPATSMTAR